jgi:uncharacterized membrane protein YphA (DoxX/SURF4 family)
MNIALTTLIYVVAAFFATLQAIILWKIGKNEINLRYLIAGEDGDASLSRFQFLIFTFVIAAGFLYLTVKGAGFPSVDEGVLMLLGISGATYALGKTLEKPAAPTPDKG